MEEKLSEIYSFLKTNRRFNKKIQETFYISAITPYDNTEDKVINLLYDIANTQSQPKIDKLSSFFKHIARKPEKLKTFKGFLSCISDNKELTYKNLYESLRIQDGWGDKTSALFAKTIFHLHNGNYKKNLIIWLDTPKSIKKDDDFYLPVDAVIIAIFRSLDSSRNWNFNNVSKKIKEYYKRDEIEVWDDLWFWGFITQKGSGDNRAFEWNENKYWMMKESEKSLAKIEEIKQIANQFIDIIKN